MSNQSLQATVVMRTKASETRALRSLDAMSVTVRGEVWELNRKELKKGHKYLRRLPIASKTLKMF